MEEETPGKTDSLGKAVICRRLNKWWEPEIFLVGLRECVKVPTGSQ